MYGDPDNDSSDVKLTEIIQVIAVLSFVPELAAMHMHTTHNEDDSTHLPITDADTLAAHPPTSRVPRLHVLLLRTPRNTNTVPPLVPLAPLPLPAGEVGVVAEARAVTMGVLKGLVGGDQLAAEYLLLTLLSRWGVGGERVCGCGCGWVWVVLSEGCR